MPFDWVETTLQLNAITVTTGFLQSARVTTFEQAPKFIPRPKYSRGDSIIVDSMRMEFIRYEDEEFRYCSVRRAGSKGRGRSVAAYEIRSSNHRRVLIET